MKFKRHILMTTALSLAITLAGAATVHAQAAAGDDTVVVTGIRKALQSSLKQKRKADRVEEVITAEDIGKFPDKNVADSLSRATGVNVVTGSANAGGFGENERISIRGTDPSLNLTLLDGHNMATGDWFVLDQTNGSRSFNYTMLPSEVVGSVEVIKASSADLIEGGIGGTVDVHVRKPLDLKAGTFNASMQGLYATLSEKWSPNLSGMYSWKNDARNFGVLVGAFYEEREFRRDGQEILGYTPQANFAGSGKTMLVPSLVGSAYFLQKRVRSGGNVMVQYKPSDDLEFDLSGLYTNLKADNENHNFMMWGSHLAATTPTAYTTKTVGADTYVTSASWAPDNTVSSLVQDDIFRKAHSQSYDLNLDVKWRLSDTLTVKGQAGYTHGEGTTDDTAAWETYWQGTGATYKLGKITEVTYPGLATDPTSAGYLNNYYSWSWGGTVSSPDKETYAKADLEWKIGDGFFKEALFGARMTDHTREVNYLAYAWSGNGANSGSNTVGLGTVYTGGRTPSNYGSDLGKIPGYTYASADAVYKYLDTHNGGRTFAFYAPQSFSVKEKTNALYAMAKIGGDMWDGNVGLRAVQTQEESLQYSASVPNKTVTNLFGSWGAVVSKHDYWDYLPSLNLNFRPSEDLVLRLGAAKVMTRPAYSQLAGYFYLVDSNFTGGAGGNPDLEPYRATQYNLNAEWYYGPEALLSVGLFSLDIDNYISTHTFTGFYTTQQTPQGHIFTLNGPVNGGKAKSQGYEISVQQPIGDNFGFIFNLTHSDGKSVTGGAVDGNSKLTYNATGYFETDKFSARLAYNFRSKFKSGDDRGTPMWQDDYGTLDSSISYNVNDHVAITFDAQNLLSEKLYYFVGSKDIPRSYYDNGHSYYLGVRLKY